MPKTALAPGQVEEVQTRTRILPANSPDNSEKEKELKQIKNQITKCEKDIEQLETDIKKLDEQLSNPDTYQKLMNDKVFFENYNQSKVKLETLLKEWETLNERISIN